MTRGKGFDPPYQIPTVSAPKDHPALTPPPARPTKRGKTPEQQAVEFAAYNLAMRIRIAAIAAYDRKRRAALGITHYRWQAVDVHGTCDVAKRNGGRIFALDDPPMEGHVGEGKCASPDWCRCIAQSIIPGFDANK